MWYSPCFAQASSTHPLNYKKQTTKKPKETQHDNKNKLQQQKNNKDSRISTKPPKTDTHKLWTKALTENIRLEDESVIEKNREFK